MVIWHSQLRSRELRLWNHLIYPISFNNWGFFFLLQKFSHELMILEQRNLMKRQEKSLRFLLMMKSWVTHCHQSVIHYYHYSLVVWNFMKNTLKKAKFIKGKRDRERVGLTKKVGEDSAVWEPTGRFSGESDTVGFSPWRCYDLGKISGICIWITKH